MLKESSSLPKGSNWIGSWPIMSVRSYSKRSNRAAACGKKRHAGLESPSAAYATDWQNWGSTPGQTKADPFPPWEIRITRPDRDVMDVIGLAISRPSDNLRHSRVKVALSIKI